eukprot:IDg9734t1
MLLQRLKDYGSPELSKAAAAFRAVRNKGIRVPKE